MDYGARTNREPVLTESTYELRTEDGKPAYVIDINSLDVVNAKKRYTSYVYLPFHTFPSRRIHFREIRHNGSNIGYLIPIDDLYNRTECVSREQSNINIRNILEVGALSLLFNDKCVDFSFQPSDESYNGNYSLPDFYPVDMAVLIVEKKRLQQYLPLNLHNQESVYEELEVSLFGYGYCSEPVMPSNSFSARTDWELGTHINFTPTSPHLADTRGAVYSFLKEIMASKSAVAVFFHLYQIIEALCSEVFYNCMSQIGHLLYQLEGPYEYGDFINKFNQGLSKPGRMKDLLRYLICHFWSARNSQFNKQLKETSNRFLECIGYGELPGSSYESLYSVRNEVVHSMSKWRLNSDAEPALWEVNHSLILVISDILRMFNSKDGQNRVSEHEWDL